MSGKIDKQLFKAHEQALEHKFCPECSGELTIRYGKRGPFLGCQNYPECNYIHPLKSNDGHVVKELGIPCPECESELVLRQGRYGMFIGCSSFPECTHIESLEQKKEEPKDHIACPSCYKGLLHEKKSRFGKTFYACDGYPNCRFIVNLEPQSGNCQECGFSLLLKKEMVTGVKLVCADKKCSTIQK
ncbi:DNA topoisomerase family protein [Aliivibrio sifiae]|uniref:DNA topoisomerase n=1 Tax=Aliivibrio sifiae TaxID=566293 RepID=A0A2S7X0G0_9GAMM|nr:topoisomerase DNA-binding C4 zinc finger domain-containing protein [Aliivibrio sifiae]PQJ83141.1 DNA topoisomerase [Aliivibrio sifiae]